MSTAGLVRYGLSSMREVRQDVALVDEILV